MKHVRLVLLMLKVSSTVGDQDVILLKDGSEIKAKVTEIGVQQQPQISISSRDRFGNQVKSVGLQLGF